MLILVNLQLMNIDIKVEKLIGKTTLKKCYISAKTWRLMGHQLLRF